jgi:hypothetical protein
MTDQIFYIHQILDKKWEYNGTARQLFIDFRKAYDSVRRKVLYNILSEFKMPRKLVGLIRMCLNETYGTVQIGFVSIAFQLCFGICHQEGPREPGRTETEWDTSSCGLC